VQIGPDGASEGAAGILSIALAVWLKRRQYPADPVVIAPHSHDAGF